MRTTPPPSPARLLRQDFEDRRLCDAGLGAQPAAVNDDAIGAKWLGARLVCRVCARRP
jgi:hypothetical protein